MIILILSDYYLMNYNKIEIGQNVSLTNGYILFNLNMFVIFNK